MRDKYDRITDEDLCYAKTSVMQRPVLIQTTKITRNLCGLFVFLAGKNKIDQYCA